MKRFLVISYWVVSILLVAIVLTSVGYSFLEALFIGSMFLPGALAAKYFFPKVKGIKDTVFITLGILAGEMLLFLIAHFIYNTTMDGQLQLLIIIFLCFRLTSAKYSFLLNRFPRRPT